MKKLKCPSHLRTFKSIINKVVVFKNKQKEKDHKREMKKIVSNKKVSLVIGCFMEIIVHHRDQAHTSFWRTHTVIYRCADDHTCTAPALPKKYNLRCKCSKKNLIKKLFSSKLLVISVQSMLLILFGFLLFANNE